MRKKHIGKLRLRTITILSVTVAMLIAVTICMTVFATVYSTTVRQDARVSASQTVEQAATAATEIGLVDQVAVKVELVPEEEAAVLLRQLVMAAMAAMGLSLSSGK